MKKLHNTLAIMAIAIIALFTAQTASAQTVLDDDEPELTSYTTIGNGAGKIVKTDFEAMFNKLIQPQYRELVKKLSMADDLKERTVCQAFLDAGAEDEDAAFISYTWDVRHDIFKIVADYLGL